MEPETVDISPEVGPMLAAIAAARLTWWQALGEWIDNSLDAAAQTISIEFHKNTIVVRDDGTGCADLTDMVKLGGHAKHSSTKLGRFGVGSKDAALWVGGTDSQLHITTVHQGMRSSILVNWPTLSKTGWRLPRPQVAPAFGDERGTVITVDRVVRRYPHGQDWATLKDDLGYLYSPAIKRGRQIKFLKPGARGASHWEPLVQWTMPPRTDIVEADIEIAGKRARVNCGIVDGPNPRSGFSYLHAFRVIEAASARGCGQFSPARICGYVQLDTSWKLSRNKDEIGEGREDLFEAVAKVCEPVLRKAEEQARDFRSSQFEMEVSSRLNAMLSQQMAKARRKRGDTEGTRTPTGLGGRHKQAEREQTGERFPARRSGGPGGSFRISQQWMGTPHHLGEVKATNILLNMDNPLIKEVWRENATAVVILAASLIGVEHCTTDDRGQRLLRDLPVGMSTKDFSIATGTLLASLPSGQTTALRVIS